jgi:hypothetical protein
MIVLNRFIDSFFSFSPNPPPPTIILFQLNIAVNGQIHVIRLIWSCFKLSALVYDCYCIKVTTYQDLAYSLSLSFYIEV